MSRTTTPRTPQRLDRPIQRILRSAESMWDNPDTRPAVRRNFRKILECGTPALGAEVYASATQHKVVHHTCKSRSCPSCGYKATMEWQRQIQASLPEIPFAAIVFTMPSVLWPFYQRNRHLLEELPLLGASVIQQWAAETHELELMGVAVRHTFGRHLNFNPHLHVLVSAAGWRDREGCWVESLHFDRSALMRRWRYAVTTQLRAALNEGILDSDMPGGQLKELFSAQYGRRWNIFVDNLTSKEHFFKYAGRYVRRPPVAQHRFSRITADVISFRTKDLKLKREVLTEHSPEEFIRLLAEHVPDLYRHTTRYFGLLAPRSRARKMAGVFAVLKQQATARLERESWADSMTRCFGVDPLCDRNGERMRLIGRRAPRACTVRPGEERSRSTQGVPPSEEER